jgi:hypothetical protein
VPEFVLAKMATAIQPTTPAALLAEGFTAVHCFTADTAALVIDFTDPS